MLARIVALALASLLPWPGGLHAQKPPAPPPDSARNLPGNVVDVTAREFWFEAPDTIPAGMTTFRLNQRGLVHRRHLAGGAARDSGAATPDDDTRGFHMLWIVRLDSGKTPADLYDAARSREPTPWADNLGGPGFAPPPGSSNATLDLAPGNYVLTCFVGSAREDRKRYHLLNGMFRPLTVVAGPRRTTVPEPEVIVTINADLSIGFSKPISAGVQRLRVDNASARAYEFQIRRITPGKTMAEAMAWRLATSRGTPRPFAPYGGLSDVPAGGSLTTTISFGPGDYFVGNAKRAGFTVAVARP